MVFLTAWQCYATYQGWMKERAVQKYDYLRIEETTIDMLRMISAIIQYSTDGWLPTNNDEFFSERTATLISRNLNIQMQAPVFPGKTWMAWMLYESDRTKKELDDYVNMSRTSLDAEVFQAIVNFNGSFLLFIPRHEVSLRNHISVPSGEKVQFPPVLCPNDCSPSMLKSLHLLRNLYEVIIERTGSKPFTMPRKIEQLGSARYTLEDLQNWKTTTRGVQFGFSLDPNNSVERRK